MPWKCAGGGGYDSPPMWTHLHLFMITLTPIVLFYRPERIIHNVADSHRYLFSLAPIGGYYVSKSFFIAWCTRTLRPRRVAWGGLLASAVSGILWVGGVRFGIRGIITPTATVRFALAVCEIGACAGTELCAWYFVPAHIRRDVWEHHDTIGQTFAAPRARTPTSTWCRRIATVILLPALLDVALAAVACPPLARSLAVRRTRCNARDSVLESLLCYTLGLYLLFYLARGRRMGMFRHITHGLFGASATYYPFKGGLAVVSRKLYAEHCHDRRARFFGNAPSDILPKLSIHCNDREHTYLRSVMMNLVHANFDMSRLDRF